MTIEYTTRSKLESLALSIPQVYTKLLLASPESEYILATEEKFPSSYFVAAIALNGIVDWVSDESYREAIQKFVDESK